MMNDEGGMMNEELTLINHHSSFRISNILPHSQRLAMNPVEDYIRYETRRQFLARGKNALGMAALASLGSNAFMARDARASVAALPGARSATLARSAIPGAVPLHFAPK